MQQPYCLQLMPEPSWLLPPGQEWDWDCWETQSTSALQAASFALMPSHLSGRFFFFLCFLCQQSLSLGPVVSDQLHTCLTSCLDPAHHAMHGPCENTMYPQVHMAREKIILKETSACGEQLFALWFGETNALYGALYTSIRMEDWEKNNFWMVKFCN